MIVFFLTAMTALGSPSLESGIEALRKVQIRTALGLLQKAKTEGPYRFKDLVRLYEHLGLAQAYLGHTEDAQASFSVLLALDPRHRLSYGLSPKATRPFEKARQNAPPAISLGVEWPTSISAKAETVALDMVVHTDPKHLVRVVKISLEAAQGEVVERVVDAPSPDAKTSISLPIARLRSGDTVLLLNYWLTGYDQERNETFRMGQRQSPIKARIAYQSSDKWHSSWWFWSLVGALAIAGGSAAVVGLTGRKADPGVKSSETLRFTIPD